MKAVMVFAFSASGTVELDIREDGSFDVIAGNGTPIGTHAQLMVDGPKNPGLPSNQFDVISQVVVRDSLRQYLKKMDLEADRNVKMDIRSFGPAGHA